MKKIDLYKFLDKNYADPRLTGVYHDGDAQVAVASDAHVMIVSKEAYNPEHAYKVIGKDGAPVDCKGKQYPDYTRCIPSTRDCSNRFPVEQFCQAVQNAANFLKNAPSAFEDGMKISNRKCRRVYLAIKAEDGRGAVPFMLNYDKAKLIADLPMDGAEMFFQSNRRAILFRNEAAGITALLMPMASDMKETDAAFRDGIRNIDLDTFNDGLWLGRTIVTAFAPVGSEAERLYSTPEKPEPVRRVKIIEGEGELTAAVRHRPEAELQAIEGLATFFRRDVEHAGFGANVKAPHVYKLENGFYVDFGRMPDDNAKAVPLLAPLDGKTVREIVTERNLTGARYNLYFQRACA